jgi:surface protein
MEWPTDILAVFLHALDALCDNNAQRAWNQLAFLTCKRDALVRIANSMPRPILLRIEAEPWEDQDGMMFKIPFMQATSVCVDVHWGDGCVDKVREKGAGYAQHKYATPGEYAVRIFNASIDGTSLDHLGFDKDVSFPWSRSWWRPLRQIVSLGRHGGLRSLSYLFTFCEELKADVRDLVLSDICDMSGMFHRATTFDQPIGAWNVSSVTDMNAMFYNAQAFNQPIADWNVGKVTNMRRMFQQAQSFNEPIGRWNVSAVTDMSSMFFCASSFNQPIGDWDVSNVVNMSSLFYRAFAFNQPIGAWDVSNMSEMFYKASSFNDPIGEWNVSNVLNMHYMFSDAHEFKHSITHWKQPRYDGTN